MGRGIKGADRLRTKQGKGLRAGERAKTGVFQFPQDVHPEDAFLSGLSHDENHRVGDDFLANNDVNNEVATVWYTVCIRRHHPEPGRLGTQGEMIQSNQCRPTPKLLFHLSAHSTASPSLSRS